MTHPDPTPHSCVQSLVPVPGVACLGSPAGVTGAGAFLLYLSRHPQVPQGSHLPALFQCHSLLQKMLPLSRLFLSLFCASRRQFSVQGPQSLSLSLLQITSLHREVEKVKLDQKR